MKNWLFLVLIGLIFFSCKESTSEENSKSQAVHLQLVESLNKQVQLHPDSAPIRMQLVNALDSLGRYGDALAQVDSMIIRDSLNNGLWFAKGQLQESMKDTSAAIRSYEKAINIYPSLESQLHLANLYAEMKDSRSLQICQAVSRVAMDRENIAHCDFIAGIYYARTGQASQAIAAFDRCINNNYTYMEAYLEKGFVYYEQKKYNEAQQVFDRAITVNNLYADAYYWKAKTLEAMGNKQEAITNYQRSLGLDKTLTEAREALNRLNS
ncbi:tetratricopeptide repeat protein [Aridibaculum aurantiacum]|uniref:tetratricopeptide repeat protein n=1 Tax=Aridibaculum aurantiacum TaxID=2810307 RepID=UPI001A97B29C|nr:tetratricopeptide repeat protein [Aridibaculum aurantiacum]